MHDAVDMFGPDMKAQFGGRQWLQFAKDLLILQQFEESRIVGLDPREGKDGDVSGNNSVGIDDAGNERRVRIRKDDDPIAVRHDRAAGRATALGGATDVVTNSRDPVRPVVRQQILVAGERSGKNGWQLGLRRTEFLGQRRTIPLRLH
jgi:hypothetical protein